MKAKLKMIFSMVVFGTIAIFVKNIPLSAGEIALYRAIIASMGIITFKLINGEKIPFSNIKKDIPILFVSGAAMGFNWIMFFSSFSLRII